MAYITPERVQETTTTTGTGAVTLGGAIAGYRAFSAACADGDTVPYTIESVDSSNIPNGDWECGVGTYSSSGGTLTRTTVISSSNANAAVNFAAGTKRVMVAPLGSNGVFNWKLIQTNTPSGVGSSSFTNIPTYFSDLYLEIAGISHNSGSAQQPFLEVSPDGSSWSPTSLISGTAGAAAVFYGGLFIPRYRSDGGIGHSGCANGSSPRLTTGSTMAWRCTGGIAALRVSWGAGQFDAGSLNLFGR